MKNDSEKIDKSAKGSLFELNAAKEISKYLKDDVDEGDGSIKESDEDDRNDNDEL